MSIPPEISTTRSPAARIEVKAFAVIKSCTLRNVRNAGLTSDRAITIATITMSSQDSCLRGLQVRLAIDRLRKFALARVCRGKLPDWAPAPHHDHFVTVIEGLRDFVRDQDDRHALSGHCGDDF